MEVDNPALLLPMVPSGLAGLGLTTFSCGVARDVLENPGKHHVGGVRPTRQGTPLAKDVWMLGIGLALMFDGKSANAVGANHESGNRRRGS
jgi:hypothetical protein